MAWWERAKVGDRVVCIDDDWEGPYFPGQPAKGDVLAISDMIVVERLSHNGCSLFLNFAPWEGGYNAACFRPAEPITEAGKKLIRKILDQVPAKEPA